MSDPELVSAYEPYAGEVINAAVNELFPNKDAGTLSGPVSGTFTLDGSKYWVDVKVIDPMGGPASSPLGISGDSWLLFVILPQDDFLADVRSSLNDTLAISVCIAAAVTVMLLAVSITMISWPLRKLNKDFEKAGSMQLDDILGGSNDRSLLSDIAQLQEGFLVLTRQLREYRSFLPPAVLAAHRQEASPPQGTVAIVFSDIVGSTKLWEADAECMTESLELHNAVIRKQIEKFRGYEVKTIGDSFMVAFGSPQDAVSFGMAVQENLMNADWPESNFETVNDRWALQFDDKGNKCWNGIAVRIGIGYDEVQSEVNPMSGRSDYRGRAVNLSSRLESSGAHGCVQISARCYEACKGMKGVEMRALGQKELKGIGNVNTYMAVSPGLAARANWIERGGATKVGPAPRRSVASSQRRRSNRSAVSSGGSVQMGARSHLTGTQLTSKVGSMSVVSRLDLSLSENPGSDAARVSYEMNRGAANVITCALRTQGNVSTIVGSEAHVTWNLVAPEGSHSMKVLIFACMVTKGPMGVTVGTASGSLMHGNVGTARQKFNTVLGFLVHGATAAAKVARSLGVKSLSCYHNQVPAAVCSSTRPVDVWGYTTSTGSVDKIFVEQVLQKEVQRRQKNQMTSEEELWEGNNTTQRPLELPAEDEYRIAFQNAVSKGDQASVDKIAELASTDPGDTVLSHVLSKLRDHVAQCPQGNHFISTVPWGSGPALPLPPVHMQSMDSSVISANSNPSKVMTPQREDGQNLPAVPTTDSGSRPQVYQAITGSASDQAQVEMTDL
eukprot:TRINITY_DN2212_c1_g1_i4.p1 TRINITY_DN2212_c1_g1~~TRINITY_DN2212_c1_g1_i4.p1  ORF type:complete len:784 (+),score=173.41 TRINITY_DN2212_c1_g1_i4:380-2731(+)